MRLAGAVGLAMACATSACAAPPRAWPSPDPPTYARLARRLDELRQGRPTQPWSATIHMWLHEPRSGRTFEGRGGLAVAPGRAVRMILLGGAGSTMMDAWVSTSDARIAVPPLGRTWRAFDGGGARLPVDVMRWWLLAPLAGRLFAASDEGPEWLLRVPDGSVVDLRLGSLERCGGTALVAVRRGAGRAARVSECRDRNGTISAGDWAELDDVATGASVRVVVEAASPSPPDEAAFVDPDDARAAR